MKFFFSSSLLLLILILLGGGGLAAGQLVSAETDTNKRRKEAARSPYTETEKQHLTKPPHPTIPRGMHNTSQQHKPAPAQTGACARVRWFCGCAASAGPATARQAVFDTNHDVGIKAKSNF